MTKPKKIDHLAALFFFLGYYIVNLLTLSVFPYVHSDEPWLAGLTRAYMTSGTIYVTEPFFDAFPRTPHAIKSLFHMIQSIYIKLFGYNITSVRLMSLMFAMVFLWIVYVISIQLTKHYAQSLLLTMISAFNIQFLYAAHFARQEIVLLMVLSLSYYVYALTTFRHTKRAVLSGIFIGIAIGIHPNAFILAMMLGCFICIDVLMNKRQFRSILYYAGILAAFAALYIVISLIGNANFFADYWAYGQTLSVDAGAYDRTTNFIEYYIKLYTQNSGTYYLPNIKGYMITFVLMLILSISLLFADFKKRLPLDQSHQLLLTSIAMTFGFNLAIFVIGRMNPTSILFMILPVILLFAGLLLRLKPTTKILAAILVIVCIVCGKDAYTQVRDVSMTTGDGYFSYEQAIKNHLPSDAVVLGNLSSGFIFEDIEFYDFRNLYYLENRTVEDYIEENGINTIIYYESYDYIHRNPQWQILYGDDSAYYEELNQLIETNGILVYAFESQVYGNRIIRYMNDYPWSVRIYYIDAKSVN